MANVNNMNECMRGGDPENANRVEDGYMNIDLHGGVGI